MTINIDKRFFSIRLKYDILIDGVESFIAKSDIFDLPFKPQLSLYDLSKNKILVIKLVSGTLFECDMQFTNGEKIELRREENGQLACYFSYQGIMYTIHFKDDFSSLFLRNIDAFEKEVSVFRNEHKIASFVKEKKYGDYILTCNNDTNKILMTAISLAYDFHLRKTFGHKYLQFSI